MRYSAAVSALALATTILAQDPVTIHVGNDGSGNKKLLFTPSSVSAPNGTVVTFVFDTPGTNHTVAQSAFAKPCEPLQGGFDSGYTPGPANAGDPPATWNLTITNDAKPIWFYCAQAASTPVHCTAGMVGAINAPPSSAPNNFAAFVSTAMAASTVSQPTPALSGSGAFASASPTIFVSANATSTATDSASASTTDSSSAATDTASSSTDASPTTQATDTASATSTPATDTNGGAVTTMTVSSTSSAGSAPASTSNAAIAGARGVGTNGLVWAAAAVFGVALL